MRRKSWGIGGYEEPDEFGVLQTHYGYPPKSVSALSYWPDSEACSKEEIRRWKAAKKRAEKKLVRDNSSLEKIHKSQKEALAYIKKKKLK